MSDVCPALELQNSQTQFCLKLWRTIPVNLVSKVWKKCMLTSCYRSCKVIFKNTVIVCPLSCNTDPTLLIQVCNDIGKVIELGVHQWRYAVMLDTPIKFKVIPIEGCYFSSTSCWPIYLRKRFTKNKINGWKLLRKSAHHIDQMKPPKKKWKYITNINQ